MAVVKLFGSIGDIAGWSEATLEGARRIELDVRENGKPPRTLMFEVGGFDASRWPVPAKPAKP